MLFNHCTAFDFLWEIRGFIDKLFLYKDTKYALIRDFKTSKETFKGKDAKDNMQDLMYSLAVKHLFPEYENKQSEFLFLKFDLIPDVKKSGIVRMEPLDEHDLHDYLLRHGLEHPQQQSSRAPCRRSSHQ